MWRRLELISLFVGLALFAALFVKLGPGRILDDIALVGWGFLYLLALSAVRHGLRTGAWIMALEREERGKFGWAEAFRVRLAGDALNYLTSGPIIGEPIKAGLLRPKVSALHGFSSLIVESVSYNLLAVLLVLGGMALLILRLSDSRLTAAAAVTAVLGAAGLFLAWFALKYRWPLLSVPLGFLAARFNRLVPAGLQDKARRLEEKVYSFYSRRSAALALILMLDLLAHAAGLAEVYLILLMLGTGGSLLLTAYIVESATKTINLVFCFVPAQIGFYEGGNALLMNSLGAGAAMGVALAIVRKLRALFWVGLGLLFLSHHLLSNRAVAQIYLSTGAQRSQGE